MAGTQIDGIALGCIAAGGVLAYAGIRGKSVPSLLTGFIQGKSPASATAADQITQSTSSSSGSSSSSSGSGGTGVDAGSNEATLKATAATFGWTGAQWTALNNIEMAEAGYDLTATNPSSGAYGMAQFIDGPSEYAEYGGNSTTAAGQSVAMCNYIKQRYGTPVVAWAFHLANGYY
jgi:hypothetical protein